MTYLLILMTSAETKLNYNISIHQISCKQEESQVILMYIKSQSEVDNSLYLPLFDHKEL